MKIFRALVLLGLFAVLVSGLSRGLRRSSLIGIQNIIIEGASSTTEQRVRQKLTAKIGDPLWKISLEKQAKLVAEDPWVESVEVRREPAHNLRVVIKERKPFAIVGSGAGSFKFIDEKSRLIDRAKSSDVSNYPVLIGKNLEEQSDLRSRLIEILRELPDTGTLSRSDVSDVQYNDERGFQFTLSKTGMVIELGKENLSLHIDRARRVVQYLDQHHIAATRIDSDYAKKVLVKVRKAR